jgi:nucleotide-binding universal stress UspA family protein
MADLYLVGVDGSEGSRRALDFAAERARLAGAKLLLAHVIDWSPYAVLPPQDLAQRHHQREEEIANATRVILEPLLAQARALQVEAEALARHGHAGGTLAEIADERGAKQIFVGRRGVSKVKALLFGSVSVGLVQVSTVPVTVVP